MPQRAVIIMPSAVAVFRGSRRTRCRPGPTTVGKKWSISDRSQKPAGLTRLEARPAMHPHDDSASSLQPVVEYAACSRPLAEAGQADAAKNGLDHRVSQKTSVIG